MSPAETSPLGRRLRLPLAIAALAITGFAGGLTLWSARAPLSAAAIAPGTVSTDGRSRTIEHLEGGIVRELHVAEGAAVREGETLFVLDDTAARAAFAATAKERDRLLVLRERLLAESADAERFGIATTRLLLGETDDAIAVLRTQSALFYARRDAYHTTREILAARTRQLGAEITGLTDRIGHQQRQLNMLAEELDGVQSLYDKGLERKPRLLALQRRQEEIRADVAQDRADIARAEQRIGETRTQLASVEAERLSEIHEALSQTEAELAAVVEDVRTQGDVLARTVIRAPISGVVAELGLRSRGEVARPGEPLAIIVPEEEALLIDARVAPLDIDRVHPGLTARVVLSAFQQRNRTPVEGRVELVSADALSDAAGGEPYYLARISIDEAALKAGGDDLFLVPGMPADVMIVTGERTLLDYLIEPLTDTLRRSLRES